MTLQHVEIFVFCVTSGSVALFCVLHVVEACVIGMISAGWHVAYAEELVLAFVERPMLSGTRVSLFVISLALLLRGTILNRTYGTLKNVYISFF